MAMTIQELREKRKKAWDTARDFLDSKRNANGVLSEEDSKTYDANGQTLTFAEEVKHQDAGLSKIFRNFSGNRLGSYLAVIAVVVCGTLIMMWYSKRRK